MNKTRLIPPFVMLAATAVVAVVTRLRDFPFGDWLIIVFGVMVFFLFIGEVLRQVIEYFIQINEKKEKESMDLLNGEDQTGKDGDQTGGTVSGVPPEE